jgi:hypothetical protein
MFCFYSLSRGNGGPVTGVYARSSAQPVFGPAFTPDFSSQRARFVSPLQRAPAAVGQEPRERG